MNKLSIILFITVCFAQINSRKIDKRNCSNNQRCNNACNENTCCTTVTCNSCVQQCTSQCNNNQQNCRSNCVTGCTNNCQNQNCNTQTCNCIGRCSQECPTQSQNCVNNCSDRCQESVEQPDGPSIIEIPTFPDVNVNNTNIVNLTTHINLNNVVNNYNNLTIPVYFNATTINNFNFTENQYDHGHDDIIDRNNTIIIDRPPPPPYYPPYPPHRPPYYPYPPPNQQQQERCCYVLHPRHCYTDPQGQKRCVIKRTRECSSACTSSVISIQPGYEQQQHNNLQCYYVQNYPYTYCGNYERSECGQCYSCGNYGYNPKECSRQEECTSPCKNSMPNCVPNGSGVYCL